MIQHDDGVFAGAAGGEIYWQSWLPTEPIGVVVIAHGLAEHSGRYAHVGQRLANANLGVYALDHHGHGRSTGIRANIIRMAHVHADLHELINRVTAHHRELPVFLLGHSLGGLIALDYVISAGATDLTGLLVSGAAVDPSVGSSIQRLAAKLLSSLIPNVGVMALDSTAVSRDPEQVARYDADQLNYHGKVRARTGAEAFAAVERVAAGLGSIRLPLMIMHGTDDRLASPDGAKLVADNVASDDVTLKLYPGLYHEIFNEPEKDDVLDDVAEWLERRCS
jgi:alpha-beta hydrolase superfamily lysophospholipase